MPVKSAVLPTVAGVRISHPDQMIQALAYG